MHHRFTLTLALVVALCPAAALVAAPEPAEAPTAAARLDRLRVDPAGIPGALVLSGDDVPTDALQAFARLAKGSRIVVLRGPVGGERSKDVTARLLDVTEEIETASLEIVRVDRARDRAVEAVTTAQAIWLAAEDTAEVTSMLSKPIRDALRAASERGAAIGASGSAATLLAETSIASREPDADDAEPATAAGLGFLPDAIVSLRTSDDGVGSPLDDLVQENPGTVGYELAKDAALVVRGRRITVIGEGSVRIVLPESSRHDGREQVLSEARANADLTALRLSAIDRRLPPFPATKPPEPRVERGTLIIIGGGGMPKGIIDRFVKLAGGADARIVVLPTAMPDPIRSQAGIVRAFENAGAAKVTVLPGRTPDVVDGEASLTALREATGLWFGGGRQWRFADAYLGTKALERMHGVLKRDGVIMGSSAGASIQAAYLARANPLGNRDIMAEGYERGLGFIKGVAIDQHFAQRRRFADMTSLVDRYPQLLGIGIDEATAIVVQGQRAEIVGRSRVHFYDRRQPIPEDGPDHLSLPAGAIYDLVDRKVVEQPTEDDAPTEKKPAA